MIYPLLKGLLFGVGMSLMLGTVFFSLIQNSIERGWNKGVLIAFGVVLSDLMFITLAILGVQLIEAGEKNPLIHGGAIILLFFLGLNLVLNKRSKLSYPQTRFGKYLYYVSNGFLLNVLNPVNFLFWAGLATVARADWGYETPQLVWFFAGCLLSIFSTEVMLSILAHRIKPFLNEKVLQWVNRVTGVIFIAIALYLILDFWGLASRLFGFSVG